MSKSHEIVTEVLNKMTKERMNTREKYNRKLRKLDIKPSFLCYRTSELYYILSDDLKCLIRHHDAYNKWPVDLI